MWKRQGWKPLTQHTKMQQAVTEANRQNNQQTSKKKKQWNHHDDNDRHENHKISCLSMSYWRIFDTHEKAKQCKHWG